jgi:DNA repair protein RadA/Sms
VTKAAPKALRGRTVFRCTECGASAPKWGGRCTSCGAWNTLVEELDGPMAAQAGQGAVRPAEAAVPIGQVSLDSWAARSTGDAEVDRVLGGGLVPGSVTVLGGEPGIGKSTLLLQLLASMAGRGVRTLLVSGEESLQQVRLRAERLGALPAELWLAATTMLPEVLGHLNDVAPAVVVIDSIQTMVDPQLSSAPGSVAQVRECAHSLVRVAKDRGISVILVGHVTKEGSLAGPRVLEHIVDTVLSFEGDRHHALRLLRAVKHRFGATGELGLFEMVEEGLVGVADPSTRFLGDRRGGVAGSLVTCAMEGARPLLVETQALVTETNLAMPRRSAQGVDGGRLALLLAVLDQHARIRLSMCDVFASAAGGVRLTEPAADLAVALAIASASAGTPIAATTMAVGEIGLGGEIRSVAHIQRRLQEAARLGFTTAVVPASITDAPPGLMLVRVTDVDAAVRALGIPVIARKARSNNGGGRSGNGPGGADESFYSAPWGRSGAKSSSSRGDNYDEFADAAEREDF